MPSVYTPDNFAGRVDYAASCFANQRCLGTRSFDTCFEMDDGDAVVVALVRRAAKNPKLAKAIPGFWQETAARYASVPCCGLRDLARELRDGKGRIPDRFVAGTAASSAAAA